MRNKYLASLLMASIFLFLTTSSLSAQEPVSTTEDGREVYLESMMEDMSADKREEIMSHPDKYVIVSSLSDLEPAKASQVSGTRTKTKGDHEPQRSNGAEDERARIVELYDKGEISRNEYDKRMGQLKGADDPASPSGDLSQDEMAEEADQPSDPQENMLKDDELEGPANDEIDSANDDSPSGNNAATQNEENDSEPDKVKEADVAPSDAEGNEENDMGAAPSDQGDIMPQGNTGENGNGGTDSDNIDGKQNGNPGQQSDGADQFEQEFQQLLEKGYSEEEIEDKLKSKYPSKF